jgi:carboxymethylenebutenolidase
MKNLILIVVVLLIVAAWFAISGRFKGSSKSMTNEEMLETGYGLPIVVQKNVEYFPGARGIFARPKGEGKYPGVVMIHENRGLRPEIAAMAEQLAKEGYLVLAVDLFNGKVVKTQEEARALTADFNQQTGIENMKAAVAYLKSKGATKVASIGWCFGGGQSLQLALFGEPMDATVIYYGSLVTEPEKLAVIKWPVLGIFGDKDRVVSLESINRLKAALNQLGIVNEIYIYPGVGHAFANPSGMNYAPEETKDAWEKTITFLHEYLK